MNQNLFCMHCRKQLIIKTVEDIPRLFCPDDSCGFVFWDNPVPVVGGIIETEEGIVLARNKLWPEGYYSIITGFVDSREAPEDAIVRECKEELGLVSTTSSLVGIYPYQEKNQIILVYHIYARGQIKLNHELHSAKVFSRKELSKWPFGQDKLPGWPFGCGWAVKDWLESTSKDEIKHQLQDA